jgi:hypothetical protein
MKTTEELNIQALLSLGSDINSKDINGNSILHLSVERYFEDQENFVLY